MATSTFLPEIHGHAETREQLGRLLAGGRIPNGLLFTGEEGLGKRTLALAFARALLAGDVRGTVDPTAPRARKFDAGTHADLALVERDEGLRLLGIDRVRALQDAFSLKPLESDRRVGVVVDADRLTEEAGNALLKLLEEPPPGTHLILTARERGAIMETLVSRCRWISLRPLPQGEVEGFLAARGVAASRRPLLAVVAEGRPGLAVRLAEAEFEETILAPALSLLGAGQEPFGRAEEVAVALKEGARNLEGARERLRPILRTAAFLLRAALKHGLGHGSAGSALAALPEPWPEALGNAEPAAVERQIVAIQDAHADLDRNTSVDLVLERLLLRLAAP